MKRLHTTDRFLILLFVCCLAAAGFRIWDLRRQNQGGGAPYELLIEWRDIDNRTASSLAKGETVYTAAGEVFGVITEMERLPVAIKLVQGGVTHEGVIPLEERCNLRITVVFEGSAREGRILHGGTTPISVGERLALYTAYCEISAHTLFCTSLAEKSVLNV